MILTLRHCRGGWWQWRSSYWVELEDRAVRSLLYAYTEKAFFVSANGPVAWSPNRRKIGDLSEALAAICILLSDIDQPTWLGKPNNQRRPHQGRGMTGRTPATGFLEGLPKPHQPKEMDTEYAIVACAVLAVVMLFAGNMMDWRAR